MGDGMTVWAEGDEIRRWVNGCAGVDDGDEVVWCTARPVLSASPIAAKRSGQVCRVEMPQRCVAGALLLLAHARSRHPHQWRQAASRRAAQVVQPRRPGLRMAAVAARRSDSYIGACHRSRLRRLDAGRRGIRRPGGRRPRVRAPRPPDQAPATPGPTLQPHLGRQRRLTGLFDHGLEGQTRDLFHVSEVSRRRYDEP